MNSITEQLCNKVQVNKLVEKSFWMKLELNLGPLDGRRVCYHWAVETLITKQNLEVIFIHQRQGHVQIQPYQLNMHAQIKKRSLLTLTQPIEDLINFARNESVYHECSSYIKWLGSLLWVTRSSRGPLGPSDDLVTHSSDPSHFLLEEHEWYTLSFQAKFIKSEMAS